MYHQFMMRIVLLFGRKLLLQGLSWVYNHRLFFFFFLLGFFYPTHNISSPNLSHANKGTHNILGLTPNCLHPRAKEKSINWVITIEKNKYPNLESLLTSIFSSHSPRVFSLAHQFYICTEHKPSNVNRIQKHVATLLRIVC